MDYARVRDVKPLERFERAAGIDFFVPVFSPEYIKAIEKKNEKQINLSVVHIDKAEQLVLLSPGAVLNLPSGIVVDLETTEDALIDARHGVMFVAFNKSGISTKFTLNVGAAAVDEDFQGEMHLSVMNVSNRLVKIHPNMKLLQFVQMPIYMSPPSEKNLSELFKNGKTKRADKSYGHTGY